MSEANPNSKEHQELITKGRERIIRDEQKIPKMYMENGKKIELINSSPELDKVLENISAVTEKGLTPEMWNKVREKHITRFKKMHEYFHTEDMKTKDGKYKYMEMVLRQKDFFAESIFEVIVEKALTNLKNVDITTLSPGDKSNDGKYVMDYGEQYGLTVYDRKTNSSITEYDGLLIVNVKTENGDIKLPIIFEQKNSEGPNGTGAKKGRDLNNVIKKAIPILSFITKPSDKSTLQVAYTLVLNHDSVADDEKDLNKNYLSAGRMENIAKMNDVEFKAKMDRVKPNNNNILLQEAKQEQNDFLNSGGVILKAPLSLIDLELMFYKMSDGINVVHNSNETTEPKIEHLHQPEQFPSYPTETELNEVYKYQKRKKQEQREGKK